MNDMKVDLQLDAWKSLSNMLSYQARSLGDKTAYTYVPPRSAPPVSLTYRELERNAKTIASYLVDLGMEGKNLLLLYPPGLEFIEAFFGCMYANVSAIPMYLPPSASPDLRLRAIAETVEISAVLTIAGKRDTVNKIAFELLPTNKCSVISTDVLPECDIETWDIKQDYSVDPLIQFTSGSTSKPKGVKVSHSNIMTNQRMIEHGFEHQGGETVVSWLPFFHDMGLIGAIMQPVYIGGSGVLMSSADFLQYPEKWLRLISDYSANSSGAPNFAYDYCVSRVTDEQMEGLDLSSWTVAYNGAEMIRPQTMRRFTERFASVGFKPESALNCYGMAEATLFIAAGRCFPDGLEPNENSEDGDLACVGFPAAETELRIVDEERNVLPEGKVGEIWARGPQIAGGYINNPAATKDNFEACLPGEPDATFLRTGDLGFMKDDGLRIVGRLKNVIIVNGRNYYGEEIEYFAATTHEYFYQAGACILQLNEGLANNEIVLVQEIRKDCFSKARENIEELEQFSKELAKQILKQFNLSVHRFVFMRENRLPRTSSGKIDRGRSPGFVKNAAEKILLEVQTR